MFFFLLGFEKEVIIMKESVKENVEEVIKMGEKVIVYGEKVIVNGVKVFVNVVWVVVNVEKVLCDGKWVVDWVIYEVRECDKVV